MYCDKCGKSNPEGALNCDYCGAEITEKKQNNKKESSKTVRLIASGVICVVVLAVLAWCIIGLVSCVSESASEKAIKNYVKAVNTGKVGTFSDNIVEAYRDIMSENDEKALEGTLNSIITHMEGLYGEKVRLSYRVLDKIEHDEKDIKAYEEKINDVIKAKNKKAEAVEVEALCTYLLKTNIKGNNDKKESFDKMTVYKVDGKWYSDEGLYIFGSGF